MSSDKAVRTAISPTRSQNYPEWYQQVIKSADLAEVSPVRGCMIIKPWGYAIWENMQRALDHAFKKRGHQNAYFPLMIPLSFMQKEAEHIAGFAKECAVVTHHRLAKDAEGKLVPASPLEEPYVIRPTSETIIGDAFSRWIQSYRDLPLCINQWANIVRWEMRTRLFLRTTEFLWQEGHTAHATAEEAMREARAMLEVYARFAEDYLAMPVLQGEKTESERFPGAVNTYCIEALMQDNKALQAGTSHFLGQHFSRGFNIKYLNIEGKEEFVWTTSWGSSTRLIGGLIMTHSDDDGLALPPRITPLHVVILPILHQEKERERILSYCESIAETLRAVTYHQHPLQVHIDQRDMTGGEKVWSWIKKGVPLRLEIGAKELEAQTVFMGERHRTQKERRTISLTELKETLPRLLDDMQQHYFTRAQERQQQRTRVIANEADFYHFFKEEEGGFAVAQWCGDEAIEEKVKADLSVTIRCLPFDMVNQPGTCIFTGKPSKQPAVFAKSY
jgi:prolyl-tRNA synthetase